MGPSESRHTCHSHPPSPRAQYISRERTSSSDRERNERRRTLEGEKKDDDTHDRDACAVAGGAARVAGSGEGAHAAQRRAGAAATGAAVGWDRQAVSIRDGGGACLAGRPLLRALAAPYLPLHVRA